MAALIHDQGALAWFVVAAYFTGALLAFRAGSAADGRERILWLGTSVTLILFGINKQLDVQADLTWAAKVAAHRGGWYELRRGVQGLFLLLIAIGGTGFAIFLWRWLREASSSAKVGAIGLVILLAFIVIRAASFHHVDHWVTIPVAGMRSGWWLELLGIAVISSAAASYRGRPEKSSATSS
jgi:hypothetical protein